MINPGVEIGWYPNSNFDRVDTEILSDDKFLPRSTRQQDGDDITMTNIIM